jgi:hypothetical protein
MECPRIQRALRWLCDLWEKLTDDSPPWDARALLLDDHRIWEPTGPRGIRRMWQRLRLATIHSIWMVRCRREEFQSQVDGDLSAATISLTQTSIRGDIRREWAQTRLAATLSEGGISHIDSSGHQLDLTMEEFERNWTCRGVLCSVHLDAQGNHQLRIRNLAEWG